jgi:hypothetical protein
MNARRAEYIALPSPISIEINYLFASAYVSAPRKCSEMYGSSPDPIGSITRRIVRGEGTRIENQATTGQHAQAAPLGRGPTRTTARSFVSGDCNVRAK